MLQAILTLAPLFACATPAQTHSPSQDTPLILPLRERARLRDDWLERRLDSVPARIMREAGIDTWIVLAREYNEDPVIETMLPATWMSARRRTILVFHAPTDADAPVERLAVARYDIGRFFASSWNKEEEPDQWARLGELVAGFEPRRIALDVSSTFALGDGLSAAENEALLAALGSNATLVTRDHNLPIRWLETRIPEEMAVYPAICAIAHRIIADGFTQAAARPNVGTTADLEWWYRERIAAWKLDTWFHPSVSLQRKGSGGTGAFASQTGHETIRPGDLLHVDFGITYLGLNTDTQQHAYVMRESEDDAPAGLLHAMAVGNRAQDILMEAFILGRSGNEILSTALGIAEAEGIDATIYTHPLGFHGHGAGPTIGLWDQQDGVPGRGDYPLHPDTAFSIELSAEVPVPEWDGQRVRMMLEEDAFFDGEACRFIDGRQTRLHLIPSAEPGTGD